MAELFSWSLVVAMLAVSGLNFTSITETVEFLFGEERVFLGNRAVAMDCGISAHFTLPRNDAADLNHNAGLSTFFNPKKAKAIRLKVQVCCTMISASFSLIKDFSRTPVPPPSGKITDSTSRKLRSPRQLPTSSPTFQEVGELSLHFFKVEC